MAKKNKINNKSQNTPIISGRLGKYPQSSLLHERTIQALLDGERGNVQFVGSNEPLRAAIILSQKSFALFHRCRKGALGESDSHCFYCPHFNRYTQSNTPNSFHSWDIGRKYLSAWFKWVSLMHRTPQWISENSLTKSTYETHFDQALRYFLPISHEWKALGVFDCVYLLKWGQ